MKFQYRPTLAISRMAQSKRDKQGKIIFFKKQLAYMWIVLKKILLGFNELRGSKFYTVYPAYDVNKMDLIIKEDGGWLVLPVL